MPRPFRLLLLCLVGLPALPCAYAAAPDALPWDAKTQGDFVVSLARDRQGSVWAGTEDNGVSRYNPRTHQWMQFTVKDGLGDDDVYALCADLRGRVWAGTGRHGVSVWNGKGWKTYDRLTGPLGAHVTALAVNPVDGSVWGATEAGLFRYAHDQWTYFTRAEGLPSDQANALAFDKHGTLYVGTACDGLAIALASSGYKQWRRVTGPDALPNTPSGKNLPSNLVNAVLATKDGNIYVGTDCGLADSRDGGKSWAYVRGRDWQEKNAGLFKPQPIIQTLAKGDLLLEDYVTALAEDAAGHLWVGHRQRGAEALEPTSLGRVYPTGPDKPSADFISALLPRQDGPMLAGRYGGGLTQVAAPEASPVLTEPASVTSASPAPFPTPAKAPTLTELNAMLVRLRHVPTAPASDMPVVQALDDDWTTQGTWVDRYGNFAAILCAMNGGGNDQVRGYRAAWVDHRGWVGRSAKADDYLRYWVQWRHTDDPRCLQNMLFGGRKEAEWDDHGETYPMTLDGPHVYGTLKVPQGRYILSCYDVNYNAHGDEHGDRRQRYRDYLVTVKVTPMTDAQFQALGSSPGKPGREQEALFAGAGPGATSRVQNFWGGVWKRFYVEMPQDGFMTVQVNRNHSFNTILPGLFLDPIGDLCGPQGPALQPAPKRTAVYKDDTKPQSVADASLRLMDRLLVLRDANPTWYTGFSRRYLVSALRELLAKKVSGNGFASKVVKEGQYDSLRPDIAACLNDIQMYDYRNHIYYSPDYYNTWKWKWLTQAAEKNDWNTDTRYVLSRLDSSLFDAFVKEQQSKQSW